MGVRAGPLHEVCSWYNRWVPPSPFVLNHDRRRRIPKQKRRVTNSAAYDATLRQLSVANGYVLHSPVAIVNQAVTLSGFAVETFLPAEPGAAEALRTLFDQVAAPCRARALSPRNCGSSPSGAWQLAELGVSCPPQPSAAGAAGSNGLPVNVRRACRNTVSPFDQWWGRWCLHDFGRSTCASWYS